MGGAGSKQLPPTDGGADGAGGPPAAGSYKVKFKMANLGPDSSGKAEMRSTTTCGGGSSITAAVNGTCLTASGDTEETTAGS